MIAHDHTSETVTDTHYAARTVVIQFKIISTRLGGDVLTVSFEDSMLFADLTCKDSEPVHNRTIYDTVYIKYKSTPV